MQFHEILLKFQGKFSKQKSVKLIYLISQFFFVLAFLNFLAHCAYFELDSSSLRHRSVIWLSFSCKAFSEWILTLINDFSCKWAAFMTCAFKVANSAWYNSSLKNVHKTIALVLLQYVNFLRYYLHSALKLKKKCNFKSTNTHYLHFQN